MRFENIRTEPGETSNNLEPRKAFIVRDMVTIKGRALMNLANDAVRNNISVANINTTALDTKPTMIER